MNPTEFQYNKDLSNKRELANQNFNKLQKTVNLNPPEFYEKHQLKDRWVRLDQSI
jgi:hypothetical protein